MQEPIVCGQCGTANPASNKFCGNCGAVLDANPAPASLSLPDWLRSDSKAAPAGGSDVAAPSATEGTAASEPVDHLPDWLREHVTEMRQRPSTEHATADAELPAWLTSEPEPEALPADADAGSALVPAAEGTANDLPDWLADLGVADAEGEKPPPAPTPIDLPEWLRPSSEGGSGTAGAPESPLALPDWLRGVDESHEGPGTNGSAAEKSPSLPSWLLGEPEQEASLGQPALPEQPAIAPSFESKPDSSSLPAWLRDEQIHQEQKPAEFMPSWLQDENVKGSAVPDAAPSEAFNQGEDAAGSAGVPSWLADASSLPYGGPEDQSTPGTVPDSLDTQPATASREQAFDDAPLSGLPDWLTAGGSGESTFHDAEVSRSSPPQEQVAPRTIELPAWLMPTADEQEAATSQSGGELPDWLISEPQDQPGGPDHMDAGVSGRDHTSAEGELPAWLRDTTAADDRMPAEHDDGTAPGVPPRHDLPVWLHEIDSTEHPAGTAQDEPAAAHQHVARTYSHDAEEDMPDVAANGHAAGLPAWLSDAETHAPAAPGTLPAWLSEHDAVAEPAATAHAPESSDSAFLTGLDLPAWLREAEPAGNPPVAEAAPAWLDGAESEVAVAPEPEPVETPDETAQPEVQRTPERVAAMELLQRLVAEPIAEPAFAPTEQRRPRVATILQAIAFLVLLLAILAVLLGPRLALGAGTAAPSESVAALATRIAALRQGTPVLLAYEWDARRGAELGPLEDALVAKLTTHRTPLLLMTTDPQGALLSSQRASQLRQSHDAFYSQAGLGFVDLGYKPGGSLALARLASNFGSVFEQDWTGRNLTGQHNVIATMCQSPRGAVGDCSLERIGMVIVMADESEDARVWIEQVASAHPGLPLTFVAPAELAPLIRPYLTRPDVTMVTGLSDAVGLQQFGGSPDERLARRADADTIGGAVFGLLVLAGAIPAVWSGYRARRRGKASVWER